MENKKKKMQTIEITRKVNIQEHVKNMQRYFNAKMYMFVMGGMTAYYLYMQKIEFALVLAFLFWFFYKIKEKYRIKLT